MIELHAIAPENELHAGERLQRMIAAAWPDVADSRNDRIDILLGVRTGCDVDVLVIVDLATPRPLVHHKRRDGGASAWGTVQHAVIAIEIKQLDVRGFARHGNQLTPRYGAKLGNKPVSVQAKDAAESVGRFIVETSNARPFVYALGWLTELDDDALHDIDPSLVGASADWAQMLDACARQHDGILRPLPGESALALPVLRRRLLTRRMTTRRDANRVESLSLQAAGPVVDRLMEVVGRKQLQLVGRGGSGKTTTLALLAVRLAESGERVLILTFHKTLRSDIEHLVRSLCAKMNVPPERIRVETTMTFVLLALTALGGIVPTRADGSDVDWPALDAALRETRAMLIGTADAAGSDAADLRAREHAQFGWDYVFVDEAQDTSDDERDFLRALYPTRAFVLSDGMDQLMRRASACDWLAGVPNDARERTTLTTSRRMLRNVALFACATAHAAGFDAWNITPHEQLPGGRVIVVEGAIVDAALMRAIVAAAAIDDADPADCLVCVPPNTRANGDGTRTELLAVLRAAQIPTWDGTVAQNRGSDIDADALRLVRYDSCRGLEGWLTLALDLDDFVAQKIAHPIAPEGETVADPTQAALRWMLIPITRAVQTLVITIRDPRSRAATVLRKAAADPAVPDGTVTWLSAARASELAATIALA